MAGKMPLVLDHLAVSGETLQAAQSYVEEALGVAMQPGGRHAVFHTHNALLGLEDGLYLEAIAVDPDAPPPARPRWFDLDAFRGTARLTNWICRSEDLDAVLTGLGRDMGAPVDLQRGDLRWRMAVPESGVLPFDNRAPALIQWKSGGHPCDVLKASGVRLERLTILHPQAEQLRTRFSEFLEDVRVCFEEGTAGYHATFATAHGKRSLTG